MSPGRKIVRHIGESLVKSMEMAIKNDKPEAAELVACECVVLAETKDHANWQLMSQCAEKARGEEAKALKDACEEVEVQEDEHLYHSKRLEPGVVDCLTRNAGSVAASRREERCKNGNWGCACGTIAQGDAQKGWCSKVHLFDS
jgi:hypothetical protein